MSDPTKPFPDNLFIRVVNLFLTSRLSVLLILAAFCLGAAAILITPREEEPQIVVPLADVFIQAPGASAAEVEKLVATPLERLLWQIDGVEYVYSISRTDMAIVTVRFFVGEDREKSLLKLHNQIAMNIDAAPPIVRGWVIKPVEIDDVSIVNLTLYSKAYDDFQLRRIGEEVLARLSEVKNISATQIIGGRHRQIRVEVLPERMAAFGISLPEIEQALQGADESATAGHFNRANRTIMVTSNAFITSQAEVSALMVGVHEGRPVYLRDIAQIQDGPCEVSSYTRIGFSQARQSAMARTDAPASYNAVTLALAKKKGTNAVTVAREILSKMEEIKAEWLPDDVMLEVTRNYGRTAQEKVNGLLSSLGFAILTVVILLAVVLGWREATVVALAVPISFCLALFVNYLFGYTINRVTLFALILSLGLVVDDPITNVDNIQRHIRMGRFDALKATLFGVGEVLPPVLMSTLAIIVCFTPLFFITGMMGPYMAPMAANVPLTVIFSTLCAISIVPWMTYHLLKKGAPPADAAGMATTQLSEGFSTRLYHGLVGPLLDSRALRYLLLGLVIFLLLVSMSLALLRLVPLKMLPFDNKDEFQIIVDMPEGTTLESTDAVLAAFENYLSRVPEVTSFVSYAGVSSPIDFNGMVRHYYLRQGGHVGDIRINLAPRKERQQQSHAIVLRLRTDLEALGRQHGANIKIIEVPPGPPVLSTIVAEIYGASDKSYADLVDQAARIRALMASEDFVVDIDDTTEASRQRLEFVIDREKAALHGVSTRTLVQTLQTAVGGSTPAMLHLDGERQPLMIQVILPKARRAGETALMQIPVKSADGSMIPLAELVTSTWLPVEQSIYHKNLERVVFVTAEVAGRAPAEAILDMQKRLRGDDFVFGPLPEGIRIQWAGEGEWKITLEVFRDMGIAFAAALLGIYLLLIVQTNSFSMPLLIMMAIPLTLLGIMPGFYLLNLFTATPVGGFENPVFFTATSMIGMIALGGIVIRNSLILIEFIQDAVRNGSPLREAILESGVIRMRPILLTAATTALGAWPITLDPVFSGLAWALIFGLLASTCFTLVIIPVTYYALFREKGSQVTPEVTESVA